jgi:hypothetical protein
VALTRIKNNQHTDANAAQSDSTTYSPLGNSIDTKQLDGIYGLTKIVDYSITGTKWANAITAVTDLTLHKAAVGGGNIGGNLVVEGNLTVIGSVTSVEATTTRISDSVIQLGYGNDTNNISANADLGIIFTLPGDNTAFLFDQTADEFQLGYTTETAYDSNVAITLDRYGNLRVEKLSSNIFAVGNLVLANNTVTTDGTANGSNINIRSNSATGNIYLSTNNTVVANNSVEISGTGQANLTVANGNLSVTGDTIVTGDTYLTGNLSQDSGNVNVNATFGTFTLGTGNITITNGGNIFNLLGNIDSNITHTNNSITNVNSYVVSNGVFGSNTDVVANANGAFSGFDYVTAIDELTGNIYSGNGYFTNNVYVDNTLFTTNLQILGDLVVPGNLRVEGNTTILNVETLASEDPIIRLNANTDANANSVVASGVDIGLQFSTNVSGAVSDRFLGVLDTDYSTLVFYSNAGVTGAAVTGNELGSLLIRSLDVTGAFANGDPANSTIGANLTVNSNASINGNLIVTQESYLNGNAFVQGMANITGDTNGLGNLTIGNANIDSFTYLWGNLTAEGNLTIGNTAGNTGYSEFVANIASTAPNNGTIVITGIGGIGVGGSVNAGANVSNLGNIQFRDDTITNKETGLGITINPNANADVIINSGLSTGNIILNGDRSNVFVLSGHQVAITSNATYGNVFEFRDNITLDINGTDAIRIPVGNNAQRPVDYTATANVQANYIGALRYNTEDETLEWWDGDEWQTPRPDFTLVTAVSITGADLSANGVYTLPNTAVRADTAGTIVSINGVVQLPGSAYTVATGNANVVTGNVITPATITFDVTDLPVSTDRIDIRAFTTTKRTVASTLTFGTATIDASSGDHFEVTGNFLPSANVTYNLGSTTRRWNELWIANSTIHMGEMQIKTSESGLEIYREDGVTLVGTIYSEQGYVATTGSAKVIDMNDGTTQILTLDQNTVITMPEAAPGLHFTLMLKQSGNKSVNWGSVRWPNGITPTLSATGNRMDIYEFYSDGVNWFGVVKGQNYTA